MPKQSESAVNLALGFNAMREDPPGYALQKKCGDETDERGECWLPACRFRHPCRKLVGAHKQDGRLGTSPGKMPETARKMRALPTEHRAAISDAATELSDAEIIPRETSR